MFKVDNFFSMVGAFVLANNKENLNIDGCLWSMVKRDRQTDRDGD